MIFVRFEGLLKRTMGLDAASVGISAIERAVQARLLACRIDDAEDYWRHLSASRTELQELIEAVVVPETWFFRDAQAFQAMARIAIEEWLPRQNEGMLRVLSLPCSTGEEPYTIAMALIDAGLAPGRFRIDAIDISGHALARARRGIYGRNSFRGKDLGFRDRHFTAVETGYRISDAVRGAVQFSQGNMFDPAFLPATDHYDIIFCRNLLIYFDAATQKRAIATLRRLLAERGVLFLGHAETSLVSEQEFTPARIPMAFAFRKGAARPRKIAHPPAPKPVRLQPAPARPAPPWPRSARAAAPRPAPQPRKADLEELRRMADQGRLEEAASGCEAYLKESGPSPDALHLLGLIKDASGNPAAAAQHYRKALYLDPDHREALGHLALLLRKQGDAAGAKLLGERMRRLDERSGK